MKSLDCLSGKSISLLHQNRLLIPLVKAEIERKELLTINLDNEIKESVKEEFFKKSGINSPEEEENWLKKNNVDTLDLEYFILKDIRTKKYSEKKFNNKIESHFLERKNNLDVIIYSLIRVQDKYKANEIYLRIIEKESSLGDLAFKYSEGVEQNTRGIIGPIPVGSAHQDLAKHLRALKPGEIKPPIKIGNSFLVVRLESLIPAKLDKFMRERMARELFNNWLEKEARQISKHLVDHQHVNVEKSNFDD